MPENFEWQAEDDVAWDFPSPPARPAGRKRRRLLLAVPLLAALLLVAGALLVRRLGRQVEEATVTVEEEVRASHDFIHQAAAGEDVELFSTYLSGRDSGWSEAQERLVAGDALLARPAFGLTLVPEARRVVSVTVAPELNAAELVAEQAYAIDIGGGLTETIWLGQTEVYRLGPNRWLLAPPDGEFWGETMTSRGHFLTLTYPVRDEAIGRRLAVDIESKLAEMCAALPGLACPDDLKVTVTLATTPQSLLPLLEARALLEGGRRLVLPAPTLVGLPTDRKSVV